jgi:hypothetical protein
MPQFWKLGDFWINADQITEVHVEYSADGTPASCKIKMLGEAARELTDAQITAAVLAHLRANEFKLLDREQA